MALKDKVALVTGGSSGIGAAIGLALAEKGCIVALCARRYDALEEVKRSIESQVEGARVFIYQCDVTQRAQVKEAVGKTEAEVGNIDILVNNAGVMTYTLMENLKEDVWEKHVDVICKGTLNGIGAVLGQMLERKSGHIVNISSDAGRKVFAGLGVYSACKMFVEGVSQALRLENVGSGIRVTTIQPGNVSTNLVAHSNVGEALDEDALREYGKPSGYKILSPSDIGGAVVYAVSQPPHVAVNEVLIEPRDEPI